MPDPDFRGAVGQNTVVRSEPTRLDRSEDCVALVLLQRPSTSLDASGQGEQPVTPSADGVRRCLACSQRALSRARKRNAGRDTAHPPQSREPRAAAQVLFLRLRGLSRAIG